MHDEDELLAVRCQLGDRDALDEMVFRWHSPLWRYARRVAGEDAAMDVVQETWLRVIRGLPRLKEPARVRAWVFGIQRRVLMDRLRAQYAAASFVDIEVVDSAGGQMDALEAEANDEALQRALEALPVIERDVLALFYLRELSLAEIADVLAIPSGTVKSRLFRARQMLRALLQTE
ncbi:MAG: sigma-70 family RNA polymerase sigma factor [Acidobacteriota bacterium]|nr:sigma-70 family RNA polymerase sigma factor [Acidobacteriota bacterium]